MLSFRAGRAPLFGDLDQLFLGCLYIDRQHMRLLARLGADLCVGQLDLAAEIKKLGERLEEQDESLEELHRKVDGQGRALARVEGVLSVRRR